MDNARVFRMAFASVYPHYITKAEKKGRTKEEVHAIIHWLTGYDEKALQKQINNKVDFETFFAQAPRINPNVSSSPATALVSISPVNCAFMALTNSAIMLSPRSFCIFSNSSAVVSACTMLGLV